MINFTTTENETRAYLDDGTELFRISRKLNDHEKSVIASGLASAYWRGNRDGIQTIRDQMRELLGVK